MILDCSVDASMLDVVAKAACDVTHTSQRGIAAPIVFTAHHKGHITVSGANNITGLIGHATCPANVVAPGACNVDVILADIAKAFKDDGVVRIRVSDGEACIEGDGTRYTLRVCANDKSTHIIAPPTKDIGISGGALGQTLRGLLAACAGVGKDSREQLRGIRVTPGQMVATDTYRLAVADGPFADGEYVIPRVMCDAMASRLKTGAKQDVTWGHDDGTCTCHIRYPNGVEYRYAARTWGCDQYPDITHIVDAFAPAWSWTASAAEMVRVLDRARRVPNRAVALEPDGDGSMMRLETLSESDDPYSGVMQAQIPVTYCGAAPSRMAYNVMYLRDGILACGYGTIRFSGTEPTKLILIESTTRRTGYRYYLMPMRLDV